MTFHILPLEGVAKYTELIEVVEELLVHEGCALGFVHNELSTHR